MDKKSDDELKQLQGLMQETEDSRALFALYLGETDQKKKTRILETIESMNTPRTTQMTGLDLAKLLNVPLQQNGLPVMIDFLNACLNVALNPVLDTLTREKRIEVIQAASACLNRNGVG